MGKIKLFLKQDSDILRDGIAVLICLPWGIYKVFFQTTDRINSLIFGSIMIVSSFVVIVSTILEYKKTRLINSCCY
jgi:Kef-type K+ transport system membrane component KefB